MNIKEYIGRNNKLVDDALERILPSKEDAHSTLVEGMRYTVLSGGKRIRPILLIAACEAVGGEQSKAISPSCAVELIHTFSLIHDDLPAMDDDDLRRGKPTLHIVMGEGNAILVGDALQALAFEILANDETLLPDTRVRLISELTHAAGMKGMAGGQVADLASEGKKIDRETLEYIHTHKTGALITASVRMGGIVGNTDEETLNALTSYGENIGLAFQIVDDILDVVGTSETLGKTAGADEGLNKATYPSIFGIDESRQKADLYFKSAIDSIEVLGEQAAALREIAEFIVKRVS